MSKPRILNVDDVPERDMSHGDRYAARIAPVGMAMDSDRLGFNVTVIEPGKRAFPHHAHLGNDEMFFVLAGEGSIRIGDETHRIRTGDFIWLPAGRASAHQIINDSKAALRYLAVSTKRSPDIAEYPDSGKMGIFAGKPPVTVETADPLFHFARVADAIGYWDGEE